MQLTASGCCGALRATRTADYGGKMSETVRHLAQRIFDRLAEQSADPPGVTRAAYAENEQQAHDLLRKEAEALGCRTGVDAAGNLIMRLPGRDPDLPCLMLGSHLDSVPHGGNYDGAAGVVAGLALIAELGETKFESTRDIVVVAFRGEEAAWFPVSYLGSHALLGRLDPASLALTRSDSGDSLEAHMRAAGFRPDAVRAGEAAFSTQEIEAFVEVHIEQGPVLAEDGEATGLVTAINGGFRYTDGRVHGRWDHSGATPREYRCDAVLGFAQFTRELDRLWEEIEASGNSATITFGMAATDPGLHGGSRVAGELAFCLDVRSQYEDVLARVRQELPSICETVTRRHGVRIDLGKSFEWPIEVMSDGLLSRLERAASDAGYTPRRMPSGAGHDAAVFAGAGIPTAMIFVRNENGSHNPAEAMDIDDFMQAVEILQAFVLRYDAPASVINS
jgi:N-carbamoyl-L-amino-acid hydrolase